MEVTLIEEMRIYILNTTRFYHEDFEEYPGAWFSCPVDFEEIRERLGVQSEEEIEIEDYELPFPLDVCVPTAGMDRRGFKEDACACVCDVV